MSYHLSLMRQALLLNYIRLTPSRFQSKEWRKKQDWYINGKKNECETFQKKMIQEITKTSLEHTSYRLNLNTLELKSVMNPFLFKNGLEWSENFDGYQEINSDILFYNLKFVCDQGGAQYRTLRSTYQFIHCQYRFSARKNVYFFNILDGDAFYRARDKFDFLSDKYENGQNVFVGDLFEFQTHWDQFFSR